jgi:protein required for attachment to host cells
MNDWILVADASSARIFHRTSLHTDPSLVVELSHPEARAKTSDLVSDGPGSKSVGSDTRRAGVPQHSEAHDNERERFARAIADHLSDEHDRFARLHLVVAPKLLGELRPLLKGTVADKLGEQISKDLVHLPVPELARRLRAELG